MFLKRFYITSIFQKPFWGKERFLEENSQKVENFFYFSSKNILFFLKMFYFPLFFSARVNGIMSMHKFTLDHNTITGSKISRVDSNDIIFPMADTEYFVDLLRND